MHMPTFAKPHLSGKKARIGSLIIPTDPYWIQALEAVVRTAHEIGDELVYLQPATTMEDLDKLAKDDLIELILAHDLDVLISTGLPVPVMDVLLAAGLPVICLAEVPKDHPLYTCMVSLYQGGKIAGEYIGQALQGKGHVVCAWAGLESYVTKGKERLSGFQDALKAYPQISVQDIPAYWSYAKAYPELKKALEHYPRMIDALFGVSDTIMLAARDVGLELGVVNKHTLLVGLNGDAEVLAGVADGSIAATVDIASEKLGASAMLMAHQITQGGPQARYIPQDFQLITRQNLATIATQKLAAIASVANRMVGYNRMQERDRLTQLEISMQINRQVGSLLERKEMFSTISHLVEQHYGYAWMCVLRWNDQEGRLVFYEGSLPPALQAVTLEQDELVRHVFETNTAVYIPDTQVTHRWHGGPDWQNIRSRAVLPIPL
jgi:ABC-type sugar transport system substrate-binding protein